LIIFIAASATSLLINRQDIGTVVISPMVSQEIISVITSFSDNINAVSVVLIVLETKTNTITIIAITTNRFSTKSNENNYY
jgi:hypothetical protein